jgi:hypothetical protein
MAKRKEESEKMVRVEPSRALSPFEEMEGWFDGILSIGIPKADQAKKKTRQVKLE